MREPFTQLFVHLIWATWDRLPLLTTELEPTVYACIQAECKALSVAVVAIGGIEDHVHLLVRLPTTVSVAELAKQIKGASSHLVTHRAVHENGFKWQGGYSAFTVSKSEVSRVRDYILNQPEHHRNGTSDPLMEHDQPDNDEPA